MRGGEAEGQHEGSVGLLREVRSEERGRFFAELPGAVGPQLPSQGFSLERTILDVEGPVASHAPEEHRSPALEGAFKPRPAGVPLADMVRPPADLPKFGGPEGEVVTSWSYIVHFSATGNNCCNYGDRVPAV